MTDRDNGNDLGLRRKLSLPNHDILEAILAERGPFVDDAEEAECKVREVGEQIMMPVPLVTLFPFPLMSEKIQIHTTTATLKTAHGGGVPDE
jgi:hypothetical protein